MPRVKKEVGSSSSSTTNNSGLRELRGRNVHINSNPNSNSRIPDLNEDDNDNQNVANQREGEEGEDVVVIRRNLRSKYLAVKNLIHGEEEDLTSPDSNKFKTTLSQVESLHKHVHNPREQVADAEAFLDIANRFAKSVAAHKNEGATPADFVSYLLRDFGRQGRATSSNEASARNSIHWKDIGLAVSNIFRRGSGCSTMLGPMNAELKVRKNTVRRKHVKPTETARPEELDNAAAEKTDTDKNMSTMFGILREYRRVRLENLIVNRTSFAQTVENLFALSFLAKDGRAEITANGSGHFVCPRNAPAAEAVTSGQVSYSHFVFRFDFKDWKLMLDSVPEGEELMPHRVHVQSEASGYNEVAEEQAYVETENAGVSTPIGKFSTNRGLVLQEQTVVNDSPESDENRKRASYNRKGKRKLM